MPLRIPFPAGRLPSLEVTQHNLGKPDPFPLDLYIALFHPGTMFLPERRRAQEMRCVYRRRDIKPVRSFQS